MLEKIVIQILVNESSFLLAHCMGVASEIASKLNF